MWYMFRQGPNDREGSYVRDFPSRETAQRVIEEMANELKKKLVIRRTGDAEFQFILKSYATTFEALAQAVIYTVKRDKRNPAGKPIAVRAGDRELKPGEAIPRYLRID